MLSCRCAVVSLLGAVLWAGCAGGPQIPPGSSCEVSALRAPFYKYGPAQAFGADDMLASGTRVTLIQRSMGFSRVMLASGVTGYISNDDLSPVAPEAPVDPASVVTNRKLEPMFTAPSKSAKVKRSNVQPTPGDPLFDVSDVPLPMKEEPKPEPEKKPE